MWLKNRTELSFLRILIEQRFAMTAKDTVLHYSVLNVISKPSCSRSKNMKHTQQQ